MTDQIKIEQLMSRFPRSKIWDESTQQTVDAVRAYIHRRPQPSLSQIQRESIRERPLSGPFHVLQDTLPAPVEDDVRQCLFRTIDELGEALYDSPALVPVPVEWVGKKTDGAVDTCEAPNQPCTFDRLSKDSTDLTILYVHGGAFFQGSPGSYRPTTSKLASLSRGRVVSVDYRLSPQHAFPAAVLDVLVAYLSLLYPSPQSAHPPINPSSIIFAGDSSGGVLLYSVLQVILHSKLQLQTSLRFHSNTLPSPIPSPAGIAILSPVGDLLHSLPSFETNRVHDIFLEVPWHRRDYPSCAIWPTDPPRPDVYCPTRSFLHPFASIALAKSWVGAPPMWFASGEELFVDGGKTIARRAAQQGVNVAWMQFEAMPHCFAILPGLNRSRQAERLMEEWARFCRQCVYGESLGKGGVSASVVSFKDLEVRPVELDDLGDPSIEDVERMIHSRVSEVEREFVEDSLSTIPSKL